jgi:hypothetical protein
MNTERKTTRDSFFRYFATNRNARDTSNTTGPGTM